MRQYVRQVAAQRPLIMTMVTRLALVPKLKKKRFQLYYAFVWIAAVIVSTSFRFDENLIKVPILSGPQYNGPLYNEDPCITSDR